MANVSIHFKPTGRRTYRIIESLQRSLYVNDFVCSVLESVEVVICNYQLDASEVPGGSLLSNEMLFDEEKFSDNYHVRFFFSCLHEFVENAANELGYSCTNQL